MTYSQQVAAWGWAVAICYLLGGLGTILWLWHATPAVTVAGVLLGPLGLAGGVILTYELIKVKTMDVTDVITYVTRGELRRHTCGAIALAALLILIFTAAVLHLILGLG